MVSLSCTFQAALLKILLDAVDVSRLCSLDKKTLHRDKTLRGVCKVFFGYFLKVNAPDCYDTTVVHLPRFAVEDRSGCARCACSLLHKTKSHQLHGRNFAVRTGSSRIGILLCYV